MSKKVIISIITLVLIIAIVAGVVVWVNNNKKDDDKKVAEINLQELNTTISGKTPFNEMATMDIDSEILSSLYEIDPDQYEEAIGKVPMMMVHASMYLVIEAKDDSVDAVKEKVENYAEAQEEMWSTYLPEQYELVKQRKLGVVGNYVYLIISENAAEIEELIKQ